MKSIGTLTLWATLVHRAFGFGVTANNDANVLANALFSGPGITIVSASFTGAAASSGTFVDGPFGIGTGAILTTGTAVGALPNGDHYVNNGQPGSSTYCGPNTFNAAILSVDVIVDVGYNGIDFEYIMASEEEGGSSDPVGIFVGGTAYARDPDGNPLTATSPWLAQPLVIVPPNSVTSYPGSSPPFLRSVLVTGAQTVVVAICDKGDSEWDSGLLIKARACSTDCDDDVRLAYVTTTVTTTTTGTSTQTASGTVSGTIIVSVTAETTTTTAEETTTTVAETTTTAEETTTTTEAETTTTTAETTTEETTTTTAETTTETTTSEETTTTTTEESTTTLETTIETTTSVETTTETSIELTTTETTTNDETTSTEETTTETTSDQSRETTTSLTTESVTSSEPSTSLESSETLSTESSDTTSQVPTTSVESSSITLDPSSSDITTQESTSESISTEISTALQLSSDESSSTETLPSTDAELPTVLSVESSTTESKQSPPATTETPSTTDPEESTSEVTPPESSSLEEPTTSDSMFTVLPTLAPPSESTSTEPIDASSAETPSPESSVSETVITVIPLPPSASSAVETSTEAAAASNLPLIEAYEFVGCLGSRQGYPTFSELLTDPEMTTSRCVELAAGRKYVGLYFRSCYVADELTDTGFVQNGQCDLPCPGDPGLFCGGNVVDRHRAVAADRLLTLYALTQTVDSSSIEVISSTSEPLIPSFIAPSLSPTSTDDIVPIDIPSSISPPDETSANDLPIAFPTQGPSPPKGYTFNSTQTVDAIYASTVTTVVYQTINPLDPEYLTVTEVTITLGYYPCGRCAVQPIPPVEMTTIVEPCKACGWQGANSITLTIPKAACTQGAGEGDSSQPGAWRRPVPHNAADGVHWGAEAKATEPASPEYGNQSPPPAGNDGEHVQQQPAATHQAQPAMPEKPAPDASLLPPTPAETEPTQPEHYEWDDHDGYASRQSSAISTQAAPKSVGGSEDSSVPTGNTPWGPTESIVVVAKGAVNGVNGLMMALLVLLVTFY
ncbi:hypothetical protein NCS52_01446300 [Fusarium sp. LHS14.1]|nr:hypothetical protein NCS52_01446300 [Fusarium sp. LHS14.1]